MLVHKVCLNHVLLDVLSARSTEFVTKLSIFDYFTDKLGIHLHGRKLDSEGVFVRARGHGRGLVLLDGVRIVSLSKSVLVEWLQILTLFGLFSSHSVFVESIWQTHFWLGLSRRF